MFYLAGVGLAFFLSLLLLSKSNKSLADKILAIWLTVITAHLLLFYFWKASLYPELLGIGIPLPLVHGPFLYLYTLALTNRPLSSRLAFIHFIPSIAVLIYLVPFIALPPEQKLFVFENNGAGYETFNLFNTILIICSGVLYVVLSSMVLRKHRISIADQFSNTEKINLNWLQNMIYGIAVIWILVIFTNDYWVFAATVFFILFIGFFGIRQVGIFHSPEPASSDKLLKNEFVVLEKIEDAIVEPRREGPEMSGPEKRKYQKSGLSTDNSEMLHRELLLMMSSQKPYLKSELSLTDLAEQLKTPPNYLSQVINEREGKNFYDYINTLRIEEFKRVAASPDSRKYTLLALAQHCGFNSKSSFNRYFKKATGKSPSEFMFTASAEK